jgi:YggT family protein
MVIPGDSAAEFVILSGTITFLNLYQNLLVARIILSWFPAASQVSFLQPLYVICDPFLRVFQGILPPVAGIDFSPILGFTLLQMGTRLTAALGMECPKGKLARLLGNHGQHTS